MFNKKFWNYFGNTIKEGRWLILKYVFVGLSFIVIGVIANKLNLKDLTYYNAVVGFSYLGYMIGFGFIEGFGLYINQNINNPEESKKYARLGFWILSCFISLIVIILAIFSKFIVRTILAIDFEVDYTFYYIMLGMFMFKAINSYTIDILKKTSNFKMQLFNSSLECVLLIAGLILVYYFGNFGLISIAIINVLTYVIVFVSSYFSLRFNKSYPVNLFEFKAVKLKRGEVGVIFSLAFSEIAWEIAYFLLSMFLLRGNNVIYNQYCYLEDVLDVVNGFFFAFVNVISIKICRCIGAEERKEAKSHSKNLLKSVFVLMVFYLVLALAFSKLIIGGMNVELRSTGFVSIVIYVILQAFRFFEWGLSTYIIGQSEIYAKASLIIEICIAIYFAIFNVVATIASLPVFLIWILIFIPSIVKICIYGVFYKGGKWLNKLKTETESETH